MWKLKSLVDYCERGDTSANIDGKWVPARPCGDSWWSRVKAAWEVLCGRADAFEWPGKQ